MSGYVPLSVREGGRRKKLAWWVSGRRQALALRLAPWLRVDDALPPWGRAIIEGYRRHGGPAFLGDTSGGAAFGAVGKEKPDPAREVCTCDCDESYFSRTGPECCMLCDRPVVSRPVGDKDPT